MEICDNVGPLQEHFACLDRCVNNLTCPTPTPTPTPEPTCTWSSNNVFASSDANGNNSNTLTIKTVVENLTGTESIPYIKTALTSPTVIQIAGELSGEGYNEQETRTFRITIQNTSTIGNATAVAIAYRNNETDTKTILFIKNEKTGVFSTGLMNSTVSNHLIPALKCAGASMIVISVCPVCAGVCSADVLMEDTGPCILCMAGCYGSGIFAATECLDFCCETGNEWCCSVKNQCR